MFKFEALVCTSQNKSDYKNDRPVLSFVFYTLQAETKVIEEDLS